MNAGPEANRALITPDENREMFDSISRRYDLLNRLMTFGLDRKWRRKAVDRLGVKSGGSYVDAGCGTGDLCLEIAGRVAAGGTVSVRGVDFSENMLRVGQEKVRARGLETSITLLRGDALALPFPDASADGVISGFVMRNLGDRMAALREWRRVLRPGGRCVILELALPETGLLRGLYAVISRTLVPLVGAMLSKRKAYVYLLDSIRSFPSPSVFQEMLREAGFSGVTSEPLFFGAVRIHCGNRSSLQKQ